MGLRGRLTRSAVAAASVLVVEVPGGWATRVAVEQSVRRRGWRPALSPADADVLVVCGSPGRALAPAVDRVWDALPGPRARTAVADPQGAEQALDGAAAHLADDAAQRDDARARPADPVAADPAGAGSGATGHGDMHSGHIKHGDMDSGHMDMDSGHMDMDSGDMDMHSGDMDMDSGDMGSGHMGSGHMDSGHMDSGHMGSGDMHSGDMDMAPSGIPLAEGADDRDGLEMDVLHVPLGPVLPHWPAGLVLRCTVAGDVVTSAEVDVRDGADGDAGLRDGPAPLPGGGSRSGAAEPPAVAVRCDAARSLLAVAGWDDAAAAAEMLRDRLLTDPGDDAAARDLARLRARVARSWVLRWSLRGLGHLDGSTTAGHGLPATLAGDVRDRLLGLLAPPEGADGAPGHRAEPRRLADPDGATGPPGPAALDLLPGLVVGLDLAAVRLVVASLEPHLRAPAAEPAHA